jgi:hypothetical protein
MMSDSRIVFKNNPYPNGHKIVEFVWGGRLDEEGKLWFDFHLKTDRYYADNPITEEEPSEEELDVESWDSKIVWGNYHACTLSSTFWGASDKSGILLDISQNKLDFDNLPRLSADPLPLSSDCDDDDMAFGIYLLGHDSCANHSITITKTSGNLFDINWTGKIALTYVGDDEFKHDFVLNIQNVKFDGFHYPQIMSQQQAMAAFSQHLANAKAFEFVDLNPKSNKREYKLVQIKIS